MTIEGFAGPRQLRRLLDAVLVIGSDLDLEATLRRITEAAVALVGATYGALGVLDEARTMLAEFITVGIDEAERTEIGELPRGHGILGVLIADPRPLRLPDLQAHPDSYGFPPNHPPMTSFLGVPIVIAGEAFGNLYLCDKRGGEAFSDVDEELVVTLAAAAAVAIDNARLHARVSELALFEERDRIARDLHDTVIQRLFAIGLGLEGALRLTGDPVVSARIDAAIAELDTTVREVRSAIFELHAPRLPGRSVRQSLLEIAAESARSLGYEPAVRFAGPVDSSVADDVAEHLLVVAREALSNVAKHAKATRVDVTVEVVDGRLTLTIEDDGRGPGDPERGGRGIENMRSRARDLGGECVVEPGGPSGCRVRWTIPVA